MKQRDKKDRTYDQMVQAASSGKQNIVEGSQISGPSKELELKLTNVAAGRPLAIAANRWPRRFK